MTKIAIVCHSPVALGANLSLVDYLRKYDKKQYDIRVFYPMGKNPNLSKKLDEIDVKSKKFYMFCLTKYLYKRSWKMKIKYFVKQMWNILIGYPFSYSSIKSFLKHWAPDVIVSNSFATIYGLYLANALKVPHVYHIREFMEADFQMTHYHLDRVKQLCRNSYALFISKSIEEYYFSRYKFKEYRQIYNNIYRDPKFQRSRELFSKDTINILMVGGFNPNKGQIDAIKAVQLLNAKGVHCRLTLCGDGETKTALMEYCRKNNLVNISFTGLLSQQEILEIRKDTDISLVCSKMEGLGRVTVESMYYESVTIGANGGETPYLLAEGRGLLYEWGNSEELAEKIIYAIQHVQESKEMTKRAYQYAIQAFNNNILSYFDYVVQKEHDNRG